MEISEIKQRLPLAGILDHYGLQPKNNMLGSVSEVLMRFKMPANGELIHQ